jgi:hypothetical protein
MKSLAVGFLLLGGVAAADESRPLKLEAVDQVIEHNDQKVQACARKLRGDTLAVLVRLEIDPNGKVVNAEPAVATPEGQCLSKVARRIKFPAAGTMSKVDYPFMLSPQLRRGPSF